MQQTPCNHPAKQASLASLYPQWPLDETALLCGGVPTPPDQIPWHTHILCTPLTFLAAHIHTPPTLLVPCPGASTARLGGPPQRKDEKDTFKSKIPLKWAISSNQPVISSYASAFGTLGGAGERKQAHLCTN
jgi:hypothetical protein